MKLGKWPKPPAAAAAAETACCIAAKLPGGGPAMGGTGGGLILSGGLFGLRLFSQVDTGGDTEWEGGPSDCDLSMLRSMIRFGVFEADLAESLVKCK